MHLPAAAQQSFHDLLRQMRRLVPRKMCEHHKANGHRNGATWRRMGLSQLHQKTAAIDKGKAGCMPINVNTVICHFIDTEVGGMSQNTLSHHLPLDHRISQSHIFFTTHMFFRSFAEYFSKKIVQFRRQQTE